MAVERPTTTIWTPEGQRMVDTSQSEVFFGLRSLELRPAGAEILSYVAQHPTIDTIIVMGEPGANKTTVLYQMVRELTFLFGPDKVRFEECLYDQVMKSSAEAMDVPRPEWGPSNWTEFARMLYEAIRAPMPEDERRVIRVSEVVGLSLVGEKDRGVTALEEIAKEMCAEDLNAPKTLILAIPPDARSQNRASLIREAVLKAEPRDVYRLLVNDCRIIPEGMGVEDTEEGGAKLQQIVSLMAGEKILQVAKDDVMKEVREWYNRISSVELREVDQVLLPESAKDMNPGYRFLYQLKTAHLDSLLHIKYGLSSQQARVVFSQYTPNKTVYWYLSMPS